MRAIIPCAGFGTRMNMKPNESKEMLLDDGKPIIQYSLDLCSKYKLDPLIITRPEKQDLIKYVEAQGVDVLQIEAGKEWPDTILKSAGDWDTKNILILPDTRFEPTNAIEQIKKSLDFGSQVVFAVHEVSDISKWGRVNQVFYVEKEPWPNPLSGHAWGLIGFTPGAGHELFENMSIKGRLHYHTLPTNFVFLDSFVDITRGDKV